MTDTVTKEELFEDTQKMIDKLMESVKDISKVRRFADLFFSDTELPKKYAEVSKELIEIHRRAYLMLDIQWDKIPNGERRIKKPSMGGGSHRFKVFMGPGDVDCREFYADDIETFRMELRGYAAELADLAWGELTGVQAKEYFRTDEVMIRTLPDIRQAEIPEKKEMYFRTIYDESEGVKCVHCGLPMGIERCSEVTYSKTHIEDAPVIIEKRVLQCPACRTRFIAARFFQEANHLESTYETLVG